MTLTKKQIAAIKARADALDRFCPATQDMHSTDLGDAIDAAREDIASLIAALKEAERERDEARALASTHVIAVATS